MMRQYYAIKKQYPGMILFFRMGDFYETFGEDARIVSRELNIALTSREKGKGERIPLAGVPYHAVDAYIAKMIRKGYRVAVCEQVEDPKKAKGLVKREVVRVVTPGTITEDVLLTKDNNYLMSLFWAHNGAGMAFVDISTGEFTCTEATGDVEQGVLSEVARFGPREIIVPSDLQTLPIREELERFCANITPYESYAFEQSHAEEILKRFFNLATLDGIGLKGKNLAICASGAALSYLEETQKSRLPLIERLRPYSSEEYLILDAITLRNLEVIRNIRDGSSEGTLLSILDACRTPMGSRLLKRWLLQPLIDIEAINERLDAVEELTSSVLLREEVAQCLREVRDMERILARVTSGTANARDLLSLAQSLNVLPRLKEYLRPLNAPLLQRCRETMHALPSLAGEIERALVPDPPASLKDGGLIKDGYSEQLDEMRKIARDGKAWIAALRKKEQERTGIKSLKVEYNKVFGYYIEVSKANLHLVPDDYIRKQTLVNAERFITPELKEKEQMILSSEEKMCALEYELFAALRDQAAAHSESIKESARAVAILDVLISLAYVAVSRNYVRPVVHKGDEISIKDGRHPVVEAMLEGAFVPNDAYMNCTDNRMIILTGPNMAGKSTYMRQIALIVLLAQMGSFVPASEAKIGIVDRIFTRVGAYDDLSRGQSTFMVEMTELANILNCASPRSLVLLDEIGRGTSTYDGMSIAWAVAEYLHSKEIVGARTILATHYHNLTEIANFLDGVKNYHIAVREKGRNIVFLRKVVPGPTNRSYGIHVASLAGVPTSVVTRAEEILKTLEEEQAVVVRKGTVHRFQTTLPVFFEEKGDEVKEALRDIDINTLTPIEALNKLHELKRKVELNGKN